MSERARMASPSVTDRSAPAAPIAQVADEGQGRSNGSGPVDMDHLTAACVLPVIGLLLGLSQGIRWATNGRALLVDWPDLSLSVRPC